MTTNTKIVLCEIARKAVSIIILVLVLVGAHALIHRITGTSNALPALAIAIMSAIGAYVVFPRVLAKVGLLPVADDLNFAIESGDSAHQVPDNFIRHPGVPQNVSIDSLKLNLPNLEILEKTADLMRFKNVVGDIIDVGFCPQPTQCPLDLNQEEELKQLFVEVDREQGSTLLTFAVKDYGGLPCMETVSEKPQKPHGVVCKASITVPRKYFYFFVSFYAAEQGITGMRDAIIFSKHSEEVGWEAAKGTGSRAESESNKEKYDAEFPDHPLSRVRRSLKLLATTIDFDDAVRQSEPYSPYVA
jgi:hypothetical protein